MVHLAGSGGSVADAFPAASPGATGQFPVPAYLPARVRPVLPWTRRHVARVAVCCQATLADLWDEALTALLRAAVYYQSQDATTYSSDRYTKPLPDAQSFRYYAKIAVNPSRMQRARHQPSCRSRPLGRSAQAGNGSGIHPSDENTDSRSTPAVAPASSTAVSS